MAELTRWAFTQPGVRRIVARTPADNAGAQGVLGRAGFRLERTDMDILHYAFQLAPPAGTGTAGRADEQGDRAVGPGAGSADDRCLGRPAQEEGDLGVGKVLLRLPGRVFT